MVLTHQQLADSHASRNKYVSAALLQELRKGKYNRTNSSAPDVLHTIVQLGLQVEGTASHTGVTLLPPPTVEALLIDRRRHELVQSFKLAMLKLASQASMQRSSSNSDHRNNSTWQLEGGHTAIALPAVRLDTVEWQRQDSQQLAAAQERNVRSYVHAMGSPTAEAAVQH